MMYIPNQLIGAPVNTQVTLECTTEASPKVGYNMPALPQWPHNLFPSHDTRPSHTGSSKTS